MHCQHLQPNGKNLNIGWSLRPGYEQFKGEIDDVAIYNRALSASEVMRLFDSAPTDINLSSNSILENVPIGASIGTLTAVDTEGGQMTYSLFAGAGDADNASFSIIGDQVKTASALDYETKSSYNIRIKVIDSGGLGFEKQLTISVINVINETMPTTGLVAWYPFNGNANDGSGNGNNGIINGASLTTDRFGTARNSYDFDGVNDYINVTNPTILNFPDGTNFTVSFFYDPGTVVTNPGGFNGIVARFTDNTGPATGWQIGRDIGSLRFEASNPCGNNTLAPIVPGNWIHIAQIYDRVAGVVRTYQNGVVVNTTSCSSITQSMINSYALKIGVEREGGQFSSGKIDDIAIYNRALDASEVMQLYTAVKSIQIISFSSLAQKTYGDEPFALTASSSSGLSVSYTSSNPSVASVSGNVLTVKAVGNVLITALQDGNGLFGAALPVQRTLTINKAMLTTTPDSKSRLYGEVNPALTIGYSGFKNGETISAIDTQPTASTTTTLSSNVGNYNIASSGGLDDNYDFTYVTGVMTISKATITAKGDSKTRQYGDVNPTFTISYSGFKNAETISVIDTQPVAITPATNTSVPGGYSIVVSGGVDNNYDFTYVNGTLTIISLTQGIVFTKLNDITETIHTFTLSASATSGLPITFSSTNNTKISVSGNTVTILGPGSVTIQAAQDGNGLYLAATPVSQTVCILPKKPIISATGLNTNNVVLTSSAAEGNQWYRNGTALPGATSSYVVDGKGSYTAKVTIENCQSNFSDPFSVIITDVEKSGLLGGLCLYPNPVQHELFINLNGITGDEPSEIIVYDISGRLICRQTMQGENGTLSIDQYPSGNYLLLISNKVFSLNTRFVKQ